MHFFRGEFIVLRGPSGGGKTTFLNMIGTIDKLSEGEIGVAEGNSECHNSTNDIPFSTELLGTRINAKTPESQLAQFRLKKIGMPCSLLLHYCLREHL